MNEGLIGCNVRYVSKKALGTDQLHRFQIEHEENRDISCSSGPGFPEKIGERVYFGFIQLERSIEQQMLILRGRYCPIPPYKVTTRDIVFPRSFRNVDIVFLIKIRQDTVLTENWSHMPP